jgi:hypothetical protein
MASFYGQMRFNSYNFDNVLGKFGTFYNKIWHLVDMAVFIK